MRTNRCIPERAYLLGTITAIFIFLFAVITPAYADIAPPQAPPGSSIGTDATTNVRMLSERILIDIQPHTLPTGESISADDYLLAQVTGSFSMRNLGQEAELLKVRFPMGDPQQQSQPGLRYPLVRGFQVKVNGTPIETSLVELADPQSVSNTTQWAMFEVNFPPDEDISIDITYSTMPTDYMPYAGFGYVLQTGAGWRETIGSAEIITRLPYPARSETVQNLSVPATFNANEIRWEFKELEPTQQHDIFFSVLVPPIEQQLRNAHAAVEANPEDADAHIKLAMAYEAAVPYHGIIVQNQDKARQAERSYERAIMLRPDDADFYGGYASLLWKHLGYQVISDENDPAVQHILAVANAALTRNPEQKQALAVLEDLNALAGKVLTLPPPYQVLTPTPESAAHTPSPQLSTPTLEASPVPTVTTSPIPSQAPTLMPSAVPSSATSNPASGFSATTVLIFAAIVVLGIVLVLALAH